MRSVFNLLWVAIFLLQMMLSAAVVAGVAQVVGRAEQWQWYHWLIASPVLYLGWSVLFLLTCAATWGQLARKYPKPRKAVVQPGQRMSRSAILSALATLGCYRAAAIIQTLPLRPLLETLLNSNRRTRTLQMRAYSPSVHLGTGVVSMGLVIDPDLTEIGDNVMIGGGAIITAHLASVRRDGGYIYVSAPVKIGDRATIGGEAGVALGCVIGEDAIVEPMSFVTPFTHVPPGEVWGGNPAQFRRRRDDLNLLALAHLRASRRRHSPAE